MFGNNINDRKPDDKVKSGGGPNAEAPASPARRDPDVHTLRRGIR